MALLVALSTLTVLPSVAKIGGFSLPAWITDNFQNQFTLGLDLQGGLHLEYSVAVDEAIENKIDQIASELETAFREKKEISVDVQRNGKDRIKLTFAKPEDVKLATDDVMAIALADFERVDVEDESEGIVHLQMYAERLTQARKESVNQAINTVTKRIDAMGIAEPNIYPKNNNVVIELPGLDNESTAITAAREDAAQNMKSLLKEAGQATATINDIAGKAEAFRLTIPGQNAAEYLVTMFGDQIIAGNLIIDERVGSQLDVLPDEGDQLPDDTVDLALTEDARDKALDESSGFRRLLKLIERAAVLEMRMIDDQYIHGDTGKPYLRALYEANLVRKGMGIAVSKESGYGKENGHNVKDPYAFYAGDRETLEDFFNSLPEEWRLPSTHMMAYGIQPMKLRRDAEPVAVWRTYVVKSRAEVTGERIVSANVEPDPQTGVPGVSVNLDRIGARAFETMSGENIGLKMAIMMDDAVVSDPIFNDRIPGGRVRITMGETPGMSVREAANDLVKVLKSGSLPARMIKEFEIRVGADLGKDSVERGFWALVVGLSLVVAFTAVYYRKAGFVAVFALLLNVVMVMAAMSLFQATLTLPGIAGIVLTIGMAVDANVIIFERVREFIREGYKARAAIEAGYDRAFTTILDSQLTTAIAGLVLWQYGSGPIRGFAITLLIGITTSIFTAVFCTRVFFDFQANRRGFDRVSI